MDRPAVIQRHVVIMGAGPAGLTAGWELTRNGVDVEVHEADPVFVGGIARTASYKGFRFDIGGHRFFTKADEVRKIWHEILDPADWLSVPRMSRIYYNERYFAYPLKAVDALQKLGVGSAVLCVLSYLRARAFPRSDERSFEDWVVNRFGVRKADVFPDNWIYIHDPSVRLGRVQNYKNWGDELWEASQDQLIALGTRELTQIGLAHARDVVDGTVVRMRQAHPVYDDSYKRNVAIVRAWLEEVATNLQLVGRNGMHKYNNQDHSMMAALLAARNLLGERWDPWKVNTDAEYHEEVRDDADAAGRLTPRRVANGVGRARSVGIIEDLRRPEARPPLGRLASGT